MLDRRPLTLLTLPAVLLWLCAAPGVAQEAAADKAKALLQEGLRQYQAKQFKDAQATLMNQEADWDALPEADKKTRDECLDKVGPAIQKQAAAEEAMANAAKALQSNQLADAQKGFAIAAASEFLPDARRREAQEQLALVNQRLADAQNGSPPPPAEAPAPAPTTAAEEMRRQLEAVAPPPSAPIDNSSLQRLLDRRAREKQAAEVNIAEAMRRARELLAKHPPTAEQFEAAQAAVGVAENVLATSKGLFEPEEYRQRHTEVEQLGRYIAKMRGDWERKEADEMRRRIEEAERIRLAEQQRQLRSKVASLMADYRSRMQAQKFEEALALLDQVLRLDPGNQAAIEQRMTLEQVGLLRKERQYERMRSLETQKNLIDLREAEIPWYELLRYPHDWREITLRREPFGAGTGSESEENRAVLQRLQMKIAEAKFDQIEFKAVIDWLRTVSGLNIHVNWGALEIAGIQQTQPVKSVHLTNVTVEKALRTVLEDVGGTTPLTYVVDDGVVTISTKDDLSGPRYRKTLVYDIRDLIITIPNMNGPRIDLNTAGTADTTNNAGTSTSIFGNANNAANDNNATMSRAEIVRNVIDLITSTIDPTSWRGDAGGDIGSVREMNGQLVVTQTAENHRALLSLLNQLREAKAIQIAIETRFLSVSTGFLNSVGLDLQMYFNLGTRLGAPAVTDPWTGASVPVKTWGLPTGWQTAGEGSPNGIDNLTPIGVRQDTASFANMLGVLSPINAGTSIGGTVATPSVSVVGTFLDDIQVDFILQATQAHSSSRSLTAPRLTLFNGQRAYVTFATQQAYVASLEPVVSDNAIAYRATVRFVPTGTVLDVQATVSADRRYVTMNVFPQIAQLNGFTNYFTVVTGTDANGSPLTGYGYLQLPNVTIQDLQTTVSVPDGGTLLLGGQKATGELEREKGAPLLSKIPIINRAFTNRGKVRDEQTLLILIKPKIIIQREEEEKAFP